MLELRETHVKILRAILDTQKRLNEKKSKTKSKKKTILHVSGYEITKKISRGIWYDNKDYLLYYQLIKITDTRKTGKQKRQYYEITSLGIIALLKKIELVSYEKFEVYLKQLFKLIGKHWNDLLNKFDVQLLYLVLKISLDQIDLIPSDIGNPKTHDFLKRFYGRRLTEKLALPFDINETTLVFSRTYTTYPKEIHMKMGSKEIPNYEKNFDEITIQITERLTFLFYYNLLRLKTDPLFETNFLFSLFKISTNISELEELDDPKINSLISDNNPEIKKYLKWESKNRKKIMSGVNSMFKLIKNDNDIGQLLKENFKFINNKIKSLDTMVILEKELNL